MRFVAIAVVLLFAGCAAPGATNEATPPIAIPADASFLALDHDHSDPALHEASAGLSLVTRVALDPGAGYLGELDVMGDILAIASEQPQGAVFLLDVSDPDAPEQLSRIPLDDAIVTDVKLAPDAKTLFVSTSSWLTLGAWDRMARDPAALPTFARALGIVVYDISDPASPREITIAPAGPDGAHMLDVHLQGGELYVYAATPAYGFAALALEPTRAAAATDPIMIFRWTGSSLERVAMYDGPRHDSPHDMTVVDDDGKTLMLVPYYFGVDVVDVTDPATPKHLGSWALADSGIENSNTHTAMLARVEGQRVLVVTPELGEAGELYVVDGNDFGAMELLGRWALPDWQERKGMIWSPHNVNIAEGKAYLAHYHGGAWVLDIGNASRLAAPEVLGYYMPNGEHVAEPTFLYDGAAPSTWDVVPAKGRIFVSDMGTGLYVLRADFPVPEAPPYGDRTS